MNDLFDNVWGDRSEIIVDHCVDITLPVRFVRLGPYPFPNISIRLRSSSSVSQVVYAPSQLLNLMTSTPGFGRRVTWTSDIVVPPGYQMTFKDALHILSTNLIQKMIAPDWAKHLTNHSRNVELAFRELKVCYSQSS